MFVRRAIVRNVVKETKAGMREVKVLDPASEAVEGPKEHSLLPGGLFTNPITKKPWNDDTAIMRHWQSVLKKSGSGTGIPIRCATPMRVFFFLRARILCGWRLRWGMRTGE